MKTSDDLKKCIETIEILSEEVWNLDNTGSFGGMYDCDRTKENSLWDTDFEDEEDVIKAEEHNIEISDQFFEKEKMMLQLFKSLKDFNDEKIIAQYNHERAVEKLNWEVSNCIRNGENIDNLRLKDFEDNYLNEFIEYTEEMCEWANTEYFNNFTQKFALC